jgi:hypothetical protein
VESTNPVSNGDRKYLDLFQDINCSTGVYSKLQIQTLQCLTGKLMRREEIDKVLVSAVMRVGVNTRYLRNRQLEYRSTE